MRAKFIFEKFIEDSDPVRDMGIGYSDAEIILYSAVKLFGDTKIFWEMTDEERQYLRSRRKYELNRSLPLSIMNWDLLKKMIEIKPFPRKFSIKVGNQHGVDFTELNYLNLFKEIFGGEWYYDDTSLVQEHKTIVDVFFHEGITFKELVEKVKTAEKLQIIK